MRFYFSKTLNYLRKSPQIKALKRMHKYSDKMKSI